MINKFLRNDLVFGATIITLIALQVLIVSCTLAKIHPKAQVVAARSVYTNTLQTLIVMRQNGSINDQEFIKIEKIRAEAATTLDILESLSNDELDLPKFELTMTNVNLLLDKLIAWQTQKEDPIP